MINHLYLGVIVKQKQYVEKAFRLVKGRIKEAIQEPKLRDVTSTYNFNGYKRIYLVHIRKTGGTSLNKMFLSLSEENADSFYTTLVDTPDHRVCREGLVYVGWNTRIINKGTYFYGFSHTPIHQLDLPEMTFTVSCFRDPIKRVISHYNMLMNYRLNKIGGALLATEGKWLGNCFDDFIQRIPPKHLLNQLYMFSSNYDINEALENVQRLSYYFFVEDFNSGIVEINRKTGLDLRPIHARKAQYRAEIKNKSLNTLKDMLQREYQFVDSIK